MIAVDDGIASGNANVADVFFLIAIVLFVIYAFVAFSAQVKPVFHSVLLGLGLACVAFAWLML